MQKQYTHSKDTWPIGHHDHFKLQYTCKGNKDGSEDTGPGLLSQLEASQEGNCGRNKVLKIRE